MPRPATFKSPNLTTYAHIVVASSLLKCRLIGSSLVIIVAVSPGHGSVRDEAGRPQGQGRGAAGRGGRRGGRGREGEGRRDPGGRRRCRPELMSAAGGPSATYSNGTRRPAMGRPATKRQRRSWLGSRRVLSGKRWDHRKHRSRPRSQPSRTTRPKNRRMVFRVATRMRRKKRSEWILNQCKLLSLLMPQKVLRKARLLMTTMTPLPELKNGTSARCVVIDSSFFDGARLVARLLLLWNIGKRCCLAPFASWARVESIPYQ
ncbi:hypothetical protein ZEAMMB73_Zm00001d050700 [Zea mays]|uniref:Uncharacterized protein n=1 Tax=Zea mays TaxID=4577 RepID=A0A1D6Q2X4_MAIZE|nr:hypothetical protein ZEAMMB73_Zm00001d050700 [Zea mays]